MPVSNSLFSGLLETLYSATLDEQRWQHFLSELCESTSSVVAFLLRNDSTRGRQVLASGGVDLPPEFDRGYITTDPVREAFMRKPKTGIVEVEDFLPRHRLMQTAYYPVMAASGVTYGTCIVPRLSTRSFDLIAMWRDDDRVRLEPDSAELLRLLYPHLQNAIRIHEALGASRQRELSMQALLDKSATASMVLSPSGKLRYCNNAARLLLADEDGIVEHRGQVSPCRSEHRSGFLRLLTEASSGNGVGAAIALQRRSGGGSPLQVVISPVRDEQLHPLRGVLVLVCDPSRSPQYPDVVLKQLYGFTQAEAELANGFLTGLSPEAIAVVRGVTIETVRSQIKSLLAKTGTKRLVDLIRLLHSIPRTIENPRHNG